MPLLVFLPTKFLGKWNSISELKNKKVNTILVYPSEPNWKVNVTGHLFQIQDKDEIDSIIKLLENVDVYIPSHPTRVWETAIMIISIAGDTIRIKVDKTEDDGTIIYTDQGDWRNDKIGSYLEKTTQYTQPVYSDTATTKF